MNALCPADLSLPMFPAFFRFIFIRRIICSPRLFESSTSPHFRTLFIADHSPLAYLRAFFSSSPQPAKSDFRNTSRRSSILLIMSAMFPRLKALRKFLCELKAPRHHAVSHLSSRRVCAGNNEYDGLWIYCFSGASSPTRQGLTHFSRSFQIWSLAPYLGMDDARQSPERFPHIHRTGIHPVLQAAAQLTYLLPITLHMLLRNSSAPPRRAFPEATRFALHWGTVARCCHFCRHRLNSRLTTPHRRTPVSSRVSRPDLVPVSFSSFTFLREGITLQQSRQDGVVRTVTFFFGGGAAISFSIFGNKWSFIR